MSNLFVFLGRQVDHKVQRVDTAIRRRAVLRNVKVIRGGFMYIQPPFVEQRPDALHKLIREYPLGTLVTQRDGGIEANHLPFLLDSTAATKLAAHLPRANPIWNDLHEREVLIIFHGPNAYVSPSWYASKQTTGKAVPTWNYVVVHAYGIARIIEDKTWLRAHLELMTDTHEAAFEHPWKISDAPNEYIEKLFNFIVGLEISVTRLEGKIKLGQNRSKEDQESVLEKLSSTGSPLASFAR
ncbi:MAG TPA: FMN-binding negative transcriptional regulator [Steroidobacteraceae bacterium]|nr:FMN-binding negative transcriptional regulator [Steroidobacteraceae bacterium]